jgi:N,N'-diacetylchitobiose non-reducing end deacetylase
MMKLLVGGALKKFSSYGAHITVVIATDGKTGVSKKYSKVKQIKSIRAGESHDSAKILGINELILWPNKTQDLKNTKKLLHQVMRVIRSVKPDLVLIHSPNDKHRDHRCLSNVTKEGIWKSCEDVLPKLGDKHRVKEVWYYEVIDPFSYPDIIVDITDFLPYKLKAMKAHNSQFDVLGADSMFDFIKGTAMVRGYLNDCKYGEAFNVCNILPRKIT